MRRCVYYNRRDRDDFKAMRLNKGEYNMNYNVICSVMFAIAICGCRSKSETPPSNTEKLDIAVSDRADWLETTEGLANVPFEIPRSLVVRMQNAYSVVRDKSLNITNNFDGEEVFGLSQCGFSNAVEIASRQRGEMKFCYDLLTEDERAAVWPFDVESFEAELESKMVCDEEGLYRLKPEFAEDIRGLKEDGLVAGNPTSRWVNHEMEQWATAQLDAVCKRMDDESFCKMSGAEVMPKGTIAWDMGEEEYFVISQGHGAWKPRDYMFVLWKDGMDPYVVVSLESFPNRKEGVAIRGWRSSPICENNVAVLEWQHRSHRLSMNPWRMLEGLVGAAEEGIVIARDNLKILLSHIPELFSEGEDDTGEQDEANVQ